MKLTWEIVEEEKKVCVCVCVFTHFCMFGCTVCVQVRERQREESERKEMRVRERGGERGERGYILELKGSMFNGDRKSSSIITMMKKKATSIEVLHVRWKKVSQN